MKVYESEKIRNVVLLGHGGCGKTTLVESIAYITGITNRMKKVDEGGTVSDFDPEEVKRGFSIRTSLIPVEWEGCKINLMDTPGFFDFEGQVYEALSVADGAVIVISGKNGVEVGTMKAYEYCIKFGIPCMFFVTDMDDPHADYMKIVNELKELYGKKIAPFHLPIYENDAFVGFVNVVKMGGRKFQADGTYEDYDINEADDADLADCREMIMEAVAETSEELMNKYFDGEPFTYAEISSALRNNVTEGTVVPVLMGCGLDGKGARMLLQAIDKYFAPPAESADQMEPFAAYVWKTIVDPFIGTYSLIKVKKGVIKSDTMLFCEAKGVEERSGKIYTLCGKTPTEVEKLYPGDIGAIAKLNTIRTGDTLSSKSNPVTLPTFEMPVPYTYMAYVVKNKGDDDKVAAGLHKLRSEDLTLKEINDKANGQLLLCGIGEQQLDIVVSKLHDRFKADIELCAPRVSYKETIRKKTTVQGKYKKQSGGHGQYGDVKMEFEPSGNLEEAYEFGERVFGGAVPKNFFPAVEKGIAECCLKGILGGYPVVGIKATLIDGSYHPVDSSEMAFKMAATTAFKTGIPDCSPVLLEPIVTLKVVVPDKYTGDIMGDLNKRRGRVLGMNPIDAVGGTKQEIVAEIPEASLLGYMKTLRATTGGAGSYSYEFCRYEQMPADVQAKVLNA